MAPQLTRSATYCGEIISRYSVPAGTPISAKSSRRRRAIRSPSLMRNDSSKYGSLMSPFHPTVVRGFSKYTRITIISSSESSAMDCFSNPAYSFAATGSWIEQGPTTTTNRSSAPLRMSTICWRASKTVREALSVSGISSATKTGGITTLLDRILRLFVWYVMDS